MSVPSRKELADTLSDLYTIHAEYEIVGLGGKPDKNWSVFYSAYILGKHGHFSTVLSLSNWLSELERDEEWEYRAAGYILMRLDDRSN